MVIVWPIQIFGLCSGNEVTVTLCSDSAHLCLKLSFQFSGHEPIYFIENKEKTLRASYDRDTQIADYMD